LGELHRQGDLRHSPIKFAVNEIGATPEEQTDRRRDNQIVAQVCPRDFVPVRVIQSEKQYADHSAVAGHSAFPNTEDRQWLMKHFGFVEENVAETPADNHTKQSAASDEVAYSLRRQISKAAFSQPE